MKRILILAAAFVLGTSAFAQTYEDLTSELQGRISFELDKKIQKGWHVYLSQEVRADDNIADLDRLSTTLGTSYKFADHFKANIDYTFIDKYKSNKQEWEPRHRLTLGFTESFKTDLWGFNFKEILQATHKSYDINRYQEAQNVLAAKLRFTTKYRGLRFFEPYAYIEGKILLNDPACTATYYSSSDSYGDYSFDGYTDIYVNRIRGAIGGEWELSGSSSIDFKLMLDYNMGKDIDTNAEGTKLKSLTYTKSFNPVLAIGYKFSF